MLDPLSISIETAQPRTVPSGPPLPRRRLLQPSPEHPDDYVMELDYSSYSDHLVCPRSFYNHHVLSREATRPNIATSFGGLFHDCEELRLRYGWSDAIRLAQQELVVSHYAANPVPPDEYRTADRMLAVLKKYNDTYAGDGWPQAVVQHDGEPMVERPFKIPFCSIEVGTYLGDYSIGDLVAGRDGIRDKLYIHSLHILLTGRIDAILSNSNYLFVVDHKTTSRDEASQKDAFNLSLQTRGYAWAARRLGFPIRGCIINNVLVRPPAKTDRASKPRETFERFTYFYDDDRLQDFEDSVRSHLSTLVHYLTTGFFPQTSLSFKSPCPTCDYNANCQLPRHQRAADLACDLYRDVTWNPVQ